MKIIVIVAALESLLVLFQFFIFDPLPGVVPNALLKWRSSGTFGNPNRVAAYLGLILAIIFDNLNYLNIVRNTVQNIIRNKFLNIFTVSLIVSALILTFSRSTMLALGLAFLSQYFYNQRKQQNKLFVFVGQTGLLNWDSIIGRWNEGFFSLQVWLSNNPWIGIGWGNYRTISGHSSVYIPNEFLSALVEGGVIGFVLFILIWKFSFSFFMSEQKQNEYKMQKITVPLFCLFLSFFDFPLKDPGFLAIAISYLLLSRSEPGL